MDAVQVCYFIVVLTKQGRLLDAYVKGRSISEALDKLIAQLDLAGNIAEFKFTRVSK